MFSLRRQQVVISQHRQQAQHHHSLLTFQDQSIVQHTTKVQHNHVKQVAKYANTPSQCEIRDRRKEGLSHSIWRGPAASKAGGAPM
jgi:hypothetical protein